MCVRHKNLHILKIVKTIQCHRHRNTQCIITLTHQGDAYIWGDVSHIDYFNTAHSINKSPHKIPISNIKKINVDIYKKIIILTKNHEICTETESIQKCNIPGIIKIKHGTRSMYILTNIGKLYSCGFNTTGELGLGNYENSDSFQEISLDNVISVSCGDTHVMAVTYQTELYGWGSNHFGNLGLGDEVVHNSPQKIILNEKSKIKSVCCGADHTMVLLENDLIYVWGFNWNGQLGLGHTDAVHSPQKLSLRCNGIIKIYCGANQTFAVTRSNEIYAWGQNNCGQLGLGDTICRYVPTKLEFNF